MGESGKPAGRSDGDGQAALDTAKSRRQRRDGRNYRLHRRQRGIQALFTAEFDSSSLRSYNDHRNSPASLRILETGTGLMRTLTAKEAQKWCSQAGFRTPRYRVHYPGFREPQFFVRVPEEFRLILAFSREILTFRDATLFGGGLIWMQGWNIGSPSDSRVGRIIIEDMRRARGELRPLDVAPALLFRDDEMVEMHTALVQVMGFGWVADLVTSTGLLVNFKSNFQAGFTVRPPSDVNDLRRALERWKPTDQDPMVVKMAALAADRKSQRSKTRTTRNKRTK